ncbi:hypothetical protein [Actinoallomurus acaciae]|uniref:Uncharacterized protein n=1 Tax=Actinoallomurus acaciae TaxID=502577 RepID=A0ABV5YK32_9ACTN
MSKGLKGGNSDTIKTNRIVVEMHVMPLIGKAKLKNLRADDVDKWLDGLMDKLSTRSLQGVHSILEWAIRQAQARNKVLKNVAGLLTTPQGRGTAEFPTRTGSPLDVGNAQRSSRAITRKAKIGED